MNKLVNIFPSTPILSVNPPIRVITRSVLKPVEDIRKCIVARAIVEEILPDGSTIRLGFSNYNTDNTPKVNKEEKITKEVKENTTEGGPVEPTVEEPKEEKPVNNYNKNKKKNKKKNKYNVYKENNSSEDNSVTEEDTNNNETLKNEEVAETTVEKIDETVEDTIDSNDDEVETIDIESIL